MLNGVIGDPTNATAEKEVKLVTNVVGHYCRLIKEIREKYVCGI
ncbi:hypothetical protein [Clostridium bowmanii]|nr:hypothetical protein [Clostridium bowmanii]